MRLLYLFAAIFTLPAVSVSGQVHETVSLQGYLTTGPNEPVPDGDYAMVFRLYGAEDAAEAIWIEPQVVAVSRGLYGVVLGQFEPLPAVDFSHPLWLGITVEEEAELSRRLLTSAPYSLSQPAPLEPTECMDIDEVACATGCTDLLTDSSNCGSCGVKCAASETCEAGVCLPDLKAPDQR